ncbi:hypothetical protein FQN57_000125 [Myotisia sp. PD_48]|nr:hypothetical protein FQN57_000125 [Myotisia sp. PD_48]
MAPFNDSPTHVFDLPQLYTKPPASDILQALDALTLKPQAFDGVSTTEQAQLRPADVSRYLTSIIGSPLGWIENEQLKESIWDTAGARICERAGRNALPSMSRIFKIPLANDSEVAITLHEPSLTSDNLGNKTWVSSYMLSKRLRTFLPSPGSLIPRRLDQPSRVLELGAGTGLVGISFAVQWGSMATVHLTDLDAIVPNLSHNVTLNEDLLVETGSSVTTGVLDWSVQTSVSSELDTKYDIILAADPLYSSDHPRWLAQTIQSQLSASRDARFILELPLRSHYIPQVNELKKRLRDLGLELLKEGKEIGYDDWEASDGSRPEVQCWWSVWGRRQLSN